MKFVEISGVKEGEQIARVRFECRNCGRSIQEVLPDAPGSVWKQYGQDKCPTCGQYSGFQHGGDYAYGLENLCRALDKNPRRPTEDAKKNIERLVNGSNLRLLFCVESEER